MPDLGSWVAEQRRVYFDNAGMARDYRTQLRGIKAPVLLTAYIGLLVFIAVVAYWGMSLIGGQSVSYLQAQLAGFYSAIIVMLEILVGLVAPILASSSIIGEYQRQSIDLLFSSPMTPKYFLVGKVLASYRYVLLLLCLSIPVSAMCVVLGGATWKDVLATYVLVSLHGLVYMSISVPIAVMTARPVTTVVWSYVATIFYFILLTVLVIPAMFSRMGSTAPPLIGLSPFMTAQAGGLQTDIGGVAVPVWIPAVILTLVFLRLMLLGAASALTQAGSKETFNLRLSGVLLCLIGPWLVGQATGRGSSISFMSGGQQLGFIVWTSSLVFLIFLPYISTWAASGGAKTWPNGWWKPKLTLRGTPGSGLPYLTLLLVTLTLGGVLGTIGGGTLRGESLVYLVGVFAVWAWAWSLGWAASAMVWRSGIEATRKLHVLFMFVVYVLPLIMFGFLESVAQAQNWGLKPGWTQNINLYAFFADKPNVALVKIVIITVLAALTWFFAERRRLVAVESMRSMA